MRFVVVQRSLSRKHGVSLFDLSPKTAPSCSNHSKARSVRASVSGYEKAAKMEEVISLR